MLSFTGLRLPLKEKQDPDWKLEHMELFPRHYVEWPIDLAVVARSICLGGLTHREAELAYFCDKMFYAPLSLVMLTSSWILCPRRIVCWQFASLQSMCRRVPGRGCSTRGR